MQHRVVLGVLLGVVLEMVLGVVISTEKLLCIYGMIANKYSKLNEDGDSLGW